MDINLDHETAPRASAAARINGHRRLQRRLLAGAAAIAIAVGAAELASVSAYSADALFSPSESAAARVPAQAAAVPGFADLVSAVKPAVVSVRVKASEQGDVSSNEQDADPFKGTPFERFFRNMPGRNGQMNPPASHMVQAQGSGFFVSSDGYIVTNNHVVDHAVNVEVVSDSGKIYHAKVIGTDKKTDLALIKVDGHTDFPFVKLAHEQPKIGEWVVAMGNPFGLGGTVTAGIVSAEGRDIGSGPYDDFLQIDAPVNRGNSGGPTFNLKGEVIGVNTAIYSPSGGSVGIAFDVPASTVASIVPQLQNHGQVTRGWLGVQIQTVTPEIADSIGLKKVGGVLVAEPQAGGPAEKAGLKSGDVIVSLDGNAVKDPRDLARRVAALGPNAQVKVGIVRDGGDQTVQLTLGELKDQTVKASTNETSKPGSIEKLGLVVAPASEVEGAGSTGVAVVETDPDGAAAELGVKSGDVILKVGGKTIAKPGDLISALQDAKAAGRKSALVLLRHGKTESFVALPVATG